MDNGASSYRRYLDGEEEAFEQIVREYFDSLVWFLESYVHDLAAAEDIAIDTFTDLVVHRHRYNFKVSLKTYLFMIGRSRALNYIKRRGKVQFAELSEAQTIPDDSLPLEQFVLQCDRNKALYRALDDLSPDLRDVVNLVYLQELSCQDAAVVMKKNVKQVYNLLYRAKEALRTVLQQEGAFKL
jgi:RNA polymerase sigma-70 factor (ECF subfamily)